MIEELFYNQLSSDRFQDRASRIMRHVCWPVCRLPVGFREDRICLATILASDPDRPS
jgi:hypothetical protein